VKAMPAVIFTILFCLVWQWVNCPPATAQMFRGYSMRAISVKEAHPAEVDATLVLGEPAHSQAAGDLMCGYSFAISSLRIARKSVQAGFAGQFGTDTHEPANLGGQAADEETGTTFGANLAASPQSADSAENKNLADDGVIVDTGDGDNQ
jgi:hypothetical protein